MKIKNPANFVSMISYLPQIELAAGKSNIGSAHIAQINNLLGTAQSQYNGGRYANAIESYKTAQSLIYGLINPRHSVDILLSDVTLMLPVGKVIEEKIAEASLKLAEVIRPDVKPPVYPVTALGVKPPDQLARLEQIGFTDTSVPTSVSDKTALGVNLLTLGQPLQAIDALQDALAGLGQLNTPEAQSARASVLLNLSSAQVLAGNHQVAVGYAAKATELFTALKDDVGRAQSLHNQAVAAQKLGQAQQAQALFEQASGLLKTAAAPFTSSATTITAPSVVSAIPLTTSHIALDAAPSSAIHASALPSVTTARTRTASLVQPNLSFSALDFIENKSAATIAVRLDGSFAGWGGIPVLNPVEAAQQKRSWSVGIEAGTKVASVTWNAGARPTTKALLDAAYAPRVSATTLADLVWRPKDIGETSLWLAHLYSFIIPQALGDCYNALGNFARAEQYYLQAAQYSYINVALEGTALWVRLANNILQWGDHLYKSEVLDEAQGVYGKLLAKDGSAPAASPLYALPAFAVASQQAKLLITKLTNPASAGVNSAISVPILIVWSRWQYLNASLDYYGTSFTPIFTFEYLQQVARGFAQQAIQAEREYIDFQVHAEAEAATRRDMEGALAMSNADVAIRNEQYQAARQDSAALDASVALANLRVSQAQSDRDSYQSKGYWQYVSQSIAAAHGAHEDWHEDEIRRLAADMEHGSWEGNAGKLAAAATLLGGQKSYEYQLQRLQDSINESQAAVPIAQAQAASAKSREEAARLSYEAGKMRADLAADALAAFDNEVFTPELWTRMAIAMKELSRGYQEWAIRCAKLMERAYNFETDRNIKIIKSSYPAASTDGLLGSDYLMRDIDSFTYDFVAQTRSKVSSLKDVISLANDYPFQFYDFQRTGKMSFETTLRDFDTHHPGFYGQQIQAVELEVVGLMPPGGVHGSLRGGNVSRYRTSDGKDKVRVHTVDTLALSEYTARNDAFVFRQDPRMHGLFEGHGVATTWEIELPRRSNNMDYRMITDVRLVVYYAARYEASLKNLVLTRPPLPGEMIHVRALLPRFDFPEAWYTFLDTAQLQFTLTPDYLPRNEENFKLDKLALRLITADGTSPADISFTITLPGRAPVTMTTDANGDIAAQPPNPLQGVMGGDLLGAWSIKISPPAGSPLLAPGGGLHGELIGQIILTAQYAFSWPV